MIYLIKICTCCRYYYFSLKYYFYKKTSGYKKFKSLPLAKIR